MFTPVENAMDTGMPSISLCMIVRNEEKYLDGCLASAKPYVDEIIVVDTGSTDKTVDIAESYGARVFTFAWIDDFAAARNESLKHARCDWVLQLDADERLNLLGFSDSLREFARVPHIDAYVVLIRSCREENGKTLYGINHNLRFFRRLPGIRYERRVHESVEPFLARRGSMTANAGFIIDHLGYQVDAGELHLKLERNLEILERYASDEPDDAFALYYLGGTYRALGRRSESLAVLERALSVSGSTDCLRAMILNAMNLIHMADRDYEKVIQTALQSLQILPHQNTARYFIGAAYYNQGKYQEALPYLYLSYQYWRRPPVEQATQLSQEYTMSEPELLKAMALCYAYQKEYIKSIAFARRYTEFCNHNPHVYQIMGLAFINLGKYYEGILNLKRSLDLGLDPSSLHFPLAYAHFKLGNYSEAIECFAAAQEIDEISMAETCRLLELMIAQDELASRLGQLIECKRAFCHQASFEQLGAVVDALCRFNRLEALKALFLAIHDRNPIELGALWHGALEYFEAQGRLLPMHGVAEALVKAHPFHRHYLHMLGTISVKLGNFCRAIEVFTAISRLSPEDEAARRILRGLLLNRGKEAQALQTIRGARGSGAAGRHPEGAVS